MAGGLFVFTCDSLVNDINQSELRKFEKTPVALAIFTYQLDDVSGKINMRLIHHGVSHLVGAAYTEKPQHLNSFKHFSLPKFTQERERSIKKR